MPCPQYFQSCPREGNNNGGILIGQNKIRIIGFADDLDIIGESLADTANAAKVLEVAANKIGLEINTEKIKIMELIEWGGPQCNAEFSL